MREERFDSQRGFTISELLVVMAAASLLVGFSLMLWLSVQTSWTRWEKQRETCDSARRELQMAALEIQRACGGAAEGDSALVLQRPAGRIVRLRTSVGTGSRSDPHSTSSGVPESSVHISPRLSETGSVAYLLTARASKDTSRSGIRVVVSPAWSSQDSFRRERAQ